jgi:hypothetical protein
MQFYTVVIYPNVLYGGKRNPVPALLVKRFARIACIGNPKCCVFGRGAICTHCGFVFGETNTLFNLVT